MDNGVTDSNGIFEFRYRGPKLSGDYEVTVKYRLPDETATHDLKQKFHVRYDGLGEFTGGTGITLTGATANHSDNHWATSVTRSRIADLGSAYYQKFNENLMVNDMSLEFGGKFDISGNCVSPHSTHQIGKNADIYPTSPSTEKWNWIKNEITIELGSEYHDEIQSASHIHFKED